MSRSTLAAADDVREAIIEYLRRSGWVPQSVEAVLPNVPRWERQLRVRGIDAIPRLGVPAPSAAEARAHNELNLLMRQASQHRDAALEHHLRNLTGVRPYKS
jgi:hypothetical protein